MKYRGEERRSSVPTQLQCVATTNGCILAWCCLVESVSLALTTTLCTGGSETARLSVLVNGVDDPIDSCISSNSVVRWVDGNDFKVLVDTILVDPVRVQDAQVTTLLAHSLLGNASKTSLVLEVIDTMVHWLSVGGSLWHMLLAVTTADSHSVDDEALLGSANRREGGKGMSADCLLLSGLAEAPTCIPIGGPCQGETVSMLGG
jgi:hypothetical protein